MTEESTHFLSCEIAGAAYSERWATRSRTPSRREYSTADSTARLMSDKSASSAGRSTGHATLTDPLQPSRNLSAILTTPASPGASGSGYNTISSQALSDNCLNCLSVSVLPSKAPAETAIARRIQRALIAPSHKTILLDVGLNAKMPLSPRLLRYLGIRRPVKSLALMLINSFPSLAKNNIR